jgi:hypothetical protein
MWLSTRGISSVYHSAVCMRFSAHRNVYSIYYQYKASRLATCPSTVHALLHVADDIEKNGPPCVTWSFALEQWCGKIEDSIKSRRRPYTSLAYHQLHLAQLYDISNRYNLADMLCLNGSSSDDKLSQYEKVYANSECK